MDMPDTVSAAEASASGFLDGDYDDAVGYYTPGPPLVDTKAPDGPIAERVVEAILAQKLAPGERLGEQALAGNVEAWRRLRLRPRVLVDVSEVSTETTVLGTPVSMPLLVAPTAIQRLAHPDGELGMARAAAAAGTVMCLSTLATAASTSTPARTAASTTTTAAASRAVPMFGSTTCRKVWKPSAPRSIDASISEPDSRRKRATALL